MQAKYDQLTMKNRSERLVSQTEVSVKTNLAAGEVAKVLGISAAANCLGTEVSEKQIAVMSYFLRWDKTIRHHS